MAENGKRRFDWHDPMGRRGRVAVIAVAAVVILGALIAAVVLGIPFF